MTDKRKVIVKINGQNFTVVGNESEKYIKYIAEFVDSKINDILSNNKRLGQSAASVLAAFNIADEYYKNCLELEGLKENVVKPLQELESIKKEFEESKEKIKLLKEDNDGIKDELLQSKRELEKSTHKNKQYDQALKLKEEELVNSQKIIADLQNKLFENQIELVQTKKELEELVKTLDNENKKSKVSYSKF